MTALVQRAGDPRIAFLVVLVALIPTWLTFPTSWNAFNEHGYLIAATVAWLIWRDGRSVLSAGGEALSEGAWFLGLFSVLWAASVVLGVGVIHQTLALLLLLVWVVTIVGPRAVVPLTPIALTAALALPVWDVFRPALRFATAVASGTAALAAGVRAEIDEYAIHLESGTVLVAAGCAGVNYLLASVALAAAYGHLFVRRGTTQLKIVAVAAAFSIVSNWVRVAVLIYVADRSAMQSELLWDHVMFGWVVWAAGMVPAYLLARRIERRDTESPTEPPATNQGQAEPVSDADAEVGRSGRVVLATLAAVVGPLAYFVLTALPRPAPSLDTPAVFAFADAADLEVQAQTAWAPNYPGIDEARSWRARVDDTVIEMSRFAFVDQRAGEELVQQTNQLGAEYEDVLSHRVVAVGPAGERLINESIVRTEQGHRLVWHWHRVAGADTPFELRAKLLELAALVRRSPPSELITVSATCGVNDCRSAAAALRRAVGERVAPPIGD